MTQRIHPNDHTRFLHDEGPKGRPKNRPRALAWIVGTCLAMAGLVWFGARQCQ